MSVPGVRRPAWAEVSRSALARNVAAVRTVLDGGALCAIVKANGYGHGATLVAHALAECGVDWFGVALVDEGIELRRAGVTLPILVLSEVAPDTVADALEHSLTLTVGSLEGATALARAADATRVARVHLKVDTGMHRMGVAPGEALAVAQLLQRSAHVEFDGVYTHFSVADSPRPTDRDFTLQQISLFDRVVDELRTHDITPPHVHYANSAGLFDYPSARGTLARVGLALYGYRPVADAPPLSPALSLHARVSAVRTVATDARPSYGRHRAHPGGVVATVPFGYADGYPRRLFAAGADVLVNGRRYPLAGMVTMDQLVIDCGSDQVRVGDPVVLLGAQGDEVITADDWAGWADTITWEILCGIGARVPRVLVD